jgi:hypothetical protein
MHGGDGGGFSGGHGHGGGFGGHHHNNPSHHHHSSNNGDYTPSGPSRGSSNPRIWIGAIGLIAVFALIVLSGYLH